MPNKGTEGENQFPSPEPDESGWLLDGLAIRPPMEEFRRLFEGKVDAESRHKYEMARRLGEKFISEREYGFGLDSGGDPC